VTARDGSNATGAPPSRTHFTGFEALRATAAVMVLVHHAASLSGGRAGGAQTLAAVFDGGVAVFFVLSGFLLYRPMVAAGVAGRAGLSWRAFWWRRVLRIVPAYWVALTILWAAGAFALGGEWWRYYLFLQIYDELTVLGGIVPAWSLCTEMAFYLVLPLFAALVGRLAAGLRAERRAVVHLVACGLLWAGGFVSRWAFDHVWPSKRGLAFNWLPTNLDLFASGMALAVVSVALAPGSPARERIDRWATPVWPWWAAGAALFGWFAYRVGPTSFEVGYQGWYWHQRQLVLAVVTVLVMVPMVFGHQEAGVARRAWAWGPIAWVGTVSYGLYLWHLDLMGLAVEHRWLGLGDLASGPTFPVLVAIGLVGGLGCAAASWYGIERPLQRFRHLVRDRATPEGAR
jgi:peptidoglycan/LPS O-acetylase OafA/YrhL